MTHISPEQLRTLLQQLAIGDLVNRCLKALSDDAIAQGKTLVFSSGQVIPIERARKFYDIRARINADSNKGMEGYEILIPALYLTAEKAISTHTVDTQDELFLIFTSTDASKFIGILANKSTHVHRYHPRSLDH